MKQVVSQLAAGAPDLPGSINIPHCQLILKPLLCQWLAEALEDLSSKPETIKHLWEKTRILKAWDHERQAKASARQNELFKTKIDSSFTAGSMDGDYEALRADHEVVTEDQGVGATTADLLREAGAPMELLDAEALA